MMNRLDQHISTVRNKLTLRQFIHAWAWGLLCLATAFWLAIIVEKLLNRTLPRGSMLFWLGLAATAATALILSLIRRPTPELAALAIDQTLGLKEKFSTAIYARPLDDPFAHAVVVDAEKSAQNVSLRSRFPLRFPRPAAAAATIFFLALMTAVFVPPLRLLATPLDKPAISSTIAHNTQDKLVKDQLPRIEEGAKLFKNDDAIRKASAELEKAMQTKDGDALRSKRSELSALQDYQKAMKDQLEKNEDFQTTQNTQAQLSDMKGADDESTPMGKAHNEIKAGDLDAAMANIGKAVNDFDKLSPAQQQKIIDQAQKLAQQLANASNDPKSMQKMTQQLMQMGASQAQAQQMAAAMQQAAQGNQQSTQQLQQMAKQMSQQLNNGQGPTPQQQQQIQSMMNKAQSLANAQARAGALSSGMKQLAGVMQQAKGAQQQPGQQGPGQQQNPSQGAMSQASQNVQQQLQQMQAQAKDAQAMQAAADASAQAAADAAAGLNPSGGGGGGQDSNKDSSASAQGDDDKKQGGGDGGGPGGNNGKGKGGAKNPDMVATPYHMKQVVDPSKDNGSGKILASRFVKAGIDPGQSAAGLRDVATAAQKDAPEEIDQDHVSRDAQQTVKDYFSGMQNPDGQ